MEGIIQPIRKVHFIVVNYNNSQFSIDFLKSLKQVVSTDTVQNGIAVVIDNNSSSAERGVLSDYINGSDDDSIVMIQSKENIGYFSAINLGIDFLKNRKNAVDIIAVGNNDIIIHKDFLISLARVEDKIKQIPVISPNLIDLDKNKQNPHLVNPIGRIRRLVHEIYYANYIFAWGISF